MGRRRKKLRYPKQCYYCQRQLEGPASPHGTAFTMDHVVPQSRGGRHKVPCCRACNEVKADMLPGEWRSFMAHNPKWWRLWRNG